MSASTPASVRADPRPRTGPRTDPRAAAAARGFSLLELLTAMAVASFVLLAVTSGFLQFLRLFRVQEGVRVMQSSGQRALARVEGALAMAGYGIEPYYAFGFVADDGTALPASAWKGLGPTRSDRLRFYARDRLFMATATPGGVAREALVLPSLAQPLAAGDILQVLCPSVEAWAYARVATPVAASPEEEVTVTLTEPTGRFPDLGEGLDAACFSTGTATLPVRVYRVEQHDLAVRTYGGRPYLMLKRVGGWEDFDAGAEAWVEDVAALRVTFLHADGTAFTPNPAAAPATLTGTRVDPPSPAFGADDWDPEPFLGTDHPMNIRAVRLSVIARAPLADQAQREAGEEGRLPAAEGVPALVLPEEAGHRHVLLTGTVVPRNLSSRFMFIPPYTTDTIPPVGTSGPCRTAAPSDGLVCWGG
jgi:type IV pilus assembly protein PilW